MAAHSPMPHARRIRAPILRDGNHKKIKQGHTHLGRLLQTQRHFVHMQKSDSEAEGMDGM